jgi:hypothetical protein
MSLMPRLYRLLAAFALALAIPTAASAQSGAKPFTPEQLDQMLAQIALYPDSLLSQVLMAATYPDEFQKAYQWSKAHPDAKGDDAVKQVESNNWDPSVASMVAFPEVLITLGEKPDYVKNLGDAFLAQPEDVMDSVQRLRAGAQKAGNLKSNEQIKVSTEPPPEPTTTTVVVKEAPPVTQTIIIEPAQPSVVYVPAYNPAVVYGPWWYPAYPPYYYPPPPGYWFSRTIATGIAWGVGIGISNALWGGFGWHNHDVNINVNRYNNINVNRRLDVNSSRTSWNHDSTHRQATYRGGDAQRQQLDRQRASGSRQDYRGKDANRDASRERAQQSMQARGVDTGGTARERAQAADRDAAKKRAQGADRSAARPQVASGDRDAARQRAQQSSSDNALRGANDRQARQQVDRGASSERAAQRSGGGGAARSSGGGAAARPSGGGSRPSGGGGGGARGGGGGGGGRGGGGGGRGR